MSAYSRPGVDAPIPVKFSELPWFARDQLGWGLTGALIIIGALHVARRFRPIPVPPAVAPAFVTFAVLPVVSFALALCAAYPGGDVFLWCRSVFEAAVYAAFLVYWFALRLSVGFASFVFHHVLHSLDGHVGTFPLPVPHGVVRLAGILFGREPLLILTQHERHHEWPRVRARDLPLLPAPRA